MTIDVLWLAGTGFGSDPDGISMAFASHLDPNRFRFRAVPYPATYGGIGMPYTESRAVGRRALINAIEATDNRVIIGGYSQGAGIAGDLAAELGAGVLSHLDVMACALIADPMRPYGAGYPGAWLVNGYGISGDRREWPVLNPVPTLWAAVEGDPITALPAGNPLRGVADMTAWWSISSPEAFLRWGTDLADRAHRGIWQRWWSLEHRRSWNGALAYARGYLLDGCHTGDYIRLGHCQRLAAALMKEVGDGA